MNDFNKFGRAKLILISIILVISFSLSGCSIFSREKDITLDANLPAAEVVFQVTIPQPLLQDEKLNLEILDDVTGLYFNASRYEMAKQNDTTYFIRIPLTISSEIKYRYVQVADNSSFEYTPDHTQVRFRILKVSGPIFVQDDISGWFDQPFSGGTGRIRGQIIDKENNAPIPNLLVCAGGLQTITASDGTFILENLKPGTHNLVIFSMDGAFETFQQGATIAEGATTPALIFINKRPLIEVTFHVEIPNEIDETLPVRFVSNISTLGNAYADLSVGSAGSAINYPVLEKSSKGKYSIRINLPVGAYLRYKYSLGDGFWNSELNSEGGFVLRELIVTGKSTVSDEVSTFNSPGVSPIRIQVSVPDYMPPNDVVFIQLNPFGWMEPVPMSSNGNTNWQYTLYSPLHLLNKIDYRYCRNAECVVAGETGSPVRSFAVSSEIQDITDEIQTWSNLIKPASPTTVVTDGSGLQPRPDFIAGVEITTSYSNTWRSSFDNGLASIAGLGSNWVILTPSWSIKRTSPLILEPVPGRDLRWDEMQNQITRVNLQKLTPILYPVVNYTQSPAEFWSQSPDGEIWWNAWFEGYQRFILQNADLAQLMNVKALIIGDPSVSPSMGPEIYDYGNVPQNAEERWRQLIQDVRARYTGEIIGVAGVYSDSLVIPSWLDQTDRIYVVFSPGLTIGETASVSEIFGLLNIELNNTLLPIYQQFNKSLIIGIDAPSSIDALSGCPSPIEECTFAPEETLNIMPNVNLQARIYNAAIISSAQNPWITGFISRGYYPYVSLQDSSSSINGKPASDVLWFWYHFLLNIAP